MARLTASESGQRERDRGQVILIAAFALAVVFIALALVLNSAIFAQNLASRSGPEQSDAITYQREMVRGVGDVMEYANYHNNSTYSDARDNFTAAVSALDNATGSQQALNSRVVGVEAVSVHSGTQIVQNNSTAAPASLYTPEGVTTPVNWTLVSGADGARQIQFNVSKDNLVTSCSNFNQSTCFHMNVTETSGTQNWTMGLYQGSSGDFRVRVYNGSGTFDTAAPVSGDYHTVDVTAGEIDGEEWAPLDFAENVDPPYDIEFVWGDHANGSYRMIVNDSALANMTSPASSNFAEGPTNDQPYVANGVYSSVIRVRYRTDSLRYRTDVRIAPGENDD